MGGRAFKVHGAHSCVMRAPSAVWNAWLIQTVARLNQVHGHPALGKHFVVKSVAGLAKSTVLFAKLACVRSSQARKKSLAAGRRSREIFAEAQLNPGGFVVVVHAPIRQETTATVARVVWIAPTQAEAASKGIPAAGSVAAPTTCHVNRRCGPTKMDSARESGSLATMVTASASALVVRFAKMVVVVLVSNVWMLLETTTVDRTICELC